MTTLPPLAPLPDSFATTRDDLHALAEHVIAPIRYLAEGHIGLSPTPHGFGTPTMFDEERQVRVIDGLLVDFRGGRDERDDIITLRAAASFLSAPIDADHAVYALSTDGDLDRALQVDREAATRLGEWFTYGSAVLQHVRDGAGPEDHPTASQIWPEHFDLAMEIGPADRRANVGASPGDAAHRVPYLYVGPQGSRPRSELWNEDFGASLGYDELLGGADPLAWIEQCLAVLRGGAVGESATGAAATASTSAAPATPGSTDPA